MWLFALLALALIFGDYSADKMFFICVVITIFTIIVKIVDFIFEKYWTWQEKKFREKRERQFAIEQEELKRRRELEEKKYREKIRKSAENICHDIQTGKRPMPNISGIIGERLSYDNAKIREFCCQNNITFDELVEMHFNGYF